MFTVFDLASRTGELSALGSDTGAGKADIHTPVNQANYTSGAYGVVLLTIDDLVEQSSHEYGDWIDSRDGLGSRSGLSWIIGGTRMRFLRLTFSNDQLKNVCG